MARHDLLLKLMREYALRGFNEWKDIDSNFRKKARAYFNNQIVESDGDFHFEIYKQSHDKFFPMPKMEDRKDVEYCFFRARKAREESYFELLIFVDDVNRLAFRFEAPGKPGSTHNYAHVQFCQRPKGWEVCAPGIPYWMPESYPAFPLPSAHDSLKLFLCMTTAVHGRDSGIEKMIFEIFQGVGTLNQAKTCIKLLKEMFD